jgi:hypothetical protein
MYSGNVGNLRMVHDCKEIAAIDSFASQDLTSANAQHLK